jgi:hypothetical protein
MSQKIYPQSSKRIPQLKTSLTFPLLLPKFMRATFTIYLHWPGVKQSASIPNSMQHKEHKTSRYNRRRKWVHHKQTNKPCGKREKREEILQKSWRLGNLQKQRGRCLKVYGYTGYIKIHLQLHNKKLFFLCFQSPHLIISSLAHQSFRFQLWAAEMYKCRKCCLPATTTLFYVKPKIET